MKRKHITAAVLIASLAVSSMMAGTAYAATEPTTTVAQGELRGFMDGDVYTFLGVPYAYVPERFALPEDPQPWEGVRAAQAFGPICPIPDQTSVGGDELVWPHRYWIQNEDCQVLNIWSHNIDKEAKQPVIVYMHGGGYKNGSSIEGVAHDGRNIAEYGDVVFVSLNHRLNALGYLDLSSYGGDFEYACNLGDEDLIQALKWVNENIEAFGGDPDNITIMGQSGGGRKVQGMLRYADCEGLVDKVVSESTSYLTPMPKDQAKEVADKTLEILGLDESNIEEIKTISYRELDDAAEAALNEMGLAWVPVENEGRLADEFLDWTADVPLIVGSVFTESSGNMSTGIGWADHNKNEWTDEEVQEKLTEQYGENAQAVADAFSALYPDKKLADAYYLAPRGVSYRNGVKEVAAKKVETGTAPVYNYMFTYEIPVNGGTTAFHCVDIMYYLHNIEIPIVRIASGGPENQDALDLQDRMASALVNFAYTGDPSTDELKWEPYTPEQPYAMRWDVESKCQILDDAELLAAATK
ncbi:carboxylesterase/lipase family protein [bacterium 1XD42-54]|nr:carboxylesterase/lipase family protein [bacterium 1XD42-54]